MNCSVSKILRSLALCVVVAGCTVERRDVIQTNRFYQENFDSGCIRDGVSFSEMILCQQKDLKSEHSQNEITNRLVFGE